MAGSRPQRRHQIKFVPLMRGAITAPGGGTCLSVVEEGRARTEKNTETGSEELAERSRGGSWRGNKKDNHAGRKKSRH